MPSQIDQSLASSTLLTVGIDSILSISVSTDILVGEHSSIIRMHCLLTGTVVKTTMIEKMSVHIGSMKVSLGQKYMIAAAMKTPML